LRESEERYSLATKGANDGLWDWDLATNEIYFSSRWESLLGYAPGEISQDPNEWFNRVHPGDRERVNKEITRFLEGNRHNFQTEYRILHKEGNYRWMLSRGFGSRDPNGKVFRIAGSQSDITERKLYDPLTGLPNRALFMDRLERLIGHARRKTDFSSAVLVLKLDAFSRVDESWGYSIGDKLLAQFIQRLQDCLTKQDTVVSLGEDTFAVLLEKVDSVADATRVANRLQEALGHPFHVESHDVYTTITIGIALSATGYKHPDDFLGDAQTAMYRAQALGNGRCEVFDPVMRAQAVARLSLETRLRKALEREEFLLHYQPIVAIEDGRLIGFEALVRWQPQDGSIISPTDFIPVAEKTGLIIPLERWVLWKACSQLHTWQSLAPDSELTISVNFSPTQWHQPDLVQMLQETLLQTGVPGRYLKLEITESTFLKDTETLGISLGDIRNLHIQLHMDDFGTGYSSLSYLRRFPIDVLKIDRSFVTSLGGNSRTKQIVKAIINLGKNLQMKVTAEGVEHPEQLRELQALECDYVQGYLFSRPLDNETAERLVLGECFWQKAFRVGPALQR
jgi:diguanylate cyclase (GGDEF)-like protein/PAS domain S-box-containing protein